ncbi:uncharacterized protein LOC106872847 [Octopus bimaculoides]|uniref:uncharacterized protein LOC106872847 n=1 Tax=Octopus bimaculoides TaxID=37653 RepID=UPI00071E36D6|nr:uncharacterized protein LOC106872847 [Octopus bimaculoides]|eukprot:XP_014775465.1 PREDICTED: uncharacterized protein LOC106872847 [Octopus bimaculoides]
MSEILSRQSNNVFTPPLKRMQVSKPAEFFTATEVERDAVTTHYINIEEKDAMLEIDDIDARSAAGFDGFPAILLESCKRVFANESCKRVFAKPLQLLLQSFLANGKLPDALKEGILCPIHKGGSRADAKNYRPIPLTSHISRVMERTVRRKLIAFLQEYDCMASTN